MANEDPEGKAIETIALKLCANLLATNSARALPKESAEGLIVLAFVKGAAWALGETEALNMFDARCEATRSTKQ